MTRLRYDNILGESITFNTDITTTGTWDVAPDFPDISGGDYAVVVVEPGTDNEEITYLTAYTSTAKSGTFTRAQEGTSGIVHTATPWQHGSTALDFEVFGATGATGPSGSQGATGATGSPGGATGATGVSASLALVYPIGSIYTETTGVNPNTTFGFGTWVAAGAGRVLVGAGTSDQVFTAGTTGGASNVTLTGAQSGTSVHSHPINDPGVPNNGNGGYTTSSGGGAPFVGSLNDGVGDNNLSNSDTGTGITVANSSAANATASHNNLQPYLVVYFWTRTA